MGTKNNPGAYDCYDNAEPDEPMFVLLGRDPAASLLVDLWAALRAVERSDDDPKVVEARACAVAMRQWRRPALPEVRQGSSLHVGECPRSDPSMSIGLDVLCTCRKAGA